MIKNTLKKLLPHFSHFYRYLRYRLFVLLGISILVGLLDGLGLAMFLPLLEMVSDPNGTVSDEKMGNLAFVTQGIQGMGLPLNLTVVLMTMLFFFTLKGLATYVESYLQVIYQQYFIRTIRIIKKKK